VHPLYEALQNPHTANRMWLAQFICAPQFFKTPSGHTVLPGAVSEDMDAEVVQCFNRFNTVFLNCFIHVNSVQ
jgi:hypothetical protein